MIRTINLDASVNYTKVELKYLDLGGDLILFNKMSLCGA